MIAKHVAPKKSIKSRFNRLVDYVTDSQDKDHRVGLVKSVNCHSATIDAAVNEVLATQQQNTRAKGDKTYHLLVSFREGEILDDKSLADIEHSICKAIGLEDHQRISAVHRDTDNLHIHIAINKIHPENLTMVEPYRAYRAMAESCDQLENKYGLEKDNHISNVRASESRALDMEAHSGQKSLITWTREQCSEKLKNSKTWGEVHQVLKEHGLQLQLKGNGLVITTDTGISIKASSVNRDLSKPALEKRLGEFVVNADSGKGFEAKEQYRKQPIPLKVDTTELYKTYKQTILTADSQLKNLLGAVIKTKNRKITALNLANKLKRFAISQEKSYLTRSLLYKRHFKAVRVQRQLIQQAAIEAKKQIYQNNYRNTWADWLKAEARRGNKEALRALRSRQPDRQNQNNRLTGVSSLPVSESDLKKADNITKKGSVINKKTGVKESENAIVLPKVVTAKTVLNALNMAKQRFEGAITLEGSQEFKALAAKVAVSINMDIKFTGDEEIHRLKLKGNEDGSNRRRFIKRGDDGVRPTTDGIYRGGRGNERGQSRSELKPNIGSVGHKPPATRRNRLFNLSKLGLASFKGKSAVLLPSDVSPNMEQQRSRSTTNSLRWGIFGARLDVNQIGAAEKYIKERSSKRDKGIDVARHEPLTKAVKGLFAGLREVDGQSLLLIETAPDIISVLPIKSSVKRLKIGDKISVNNQSSVRLMSGKER